MQEITVVLCVASIFPFFVFLRSSFLSPVFLIFIHFYLGFCGKYLYLLYDENAIRLTEFIGANYAVFFELQMFYWVAFICYLHFRGRSSDKKMPEMLRVDFVDQRSFVLVSVLSIGCILIYYGLMILNFGSLAAMIDAHLNRVSDNVQGLAYAAVFSDLFIVGSLFLAFIGKVLRGRYLLVSYLVLLIGILTLLIQGGRGNLIQYIVSLAIISSLMTKKVSVFKVQYLFIFFAFVFLALAGLAARKANQLNIDFVDALDEVNSSLVGNVLSPFSLYDHYALSREYVEVNGYDYGKFYLEQFTRPIPRSLWNGKPEVLGKKMRLEFFGDDKGGIPPGYVGESYISFGVFGVFFFAIFIAFIVAFLQGVFFQAKVKKGLIPFVAILTPYLFFNLPRSGLDVAFMRISIMVVSFMIFQYLTRLKFSRSIKVKFRSRT